jgi:hypothetical protein
MYLDYVKQGTFGISMGALHIVAKNERLTPNDLLAVFFNPANKDQSLSLMFHLLKGYTQMCCDEFCWIYADVYIDAKRRSTIKQFISDQKTELRDIYIRNQRQILTIVGILEW